MGMKILLGKSAKKAIEGYDAPTRTRIWVAIQAIPNGDIKLMLGYEGLFRLRVGKYRILFSYAKQDGIDAIAVHDIGTRGDIYK